MSNFKIVTSQHKLSTRGEIEFHDLSEEVRRAVRESGVKNGIVHVFAPHATGVLILTENDADLLQDIKVFLSELVPRNQSYNHPSNAHAHLRSIVFPPDKTLPVIDGEAELGTWQSVVFVETDVYPRKRTITIQVMGE